MGKLTLTAEDAREVVWDNDAYWETIESKIVDTEDYKEYYEGVFKHVESGKYYAIDWTSNRDDAPFHGDNYVDMIEVEKVECTSYEWVSVV